MLKLKLPLILCFAIALASGSLMAADVSGKWSGTTVTKTPDGETGQGTAWMFLKQSGALLTGTAGGTADQQSEIKDGKADGDHFEFKVVVGEATANVKLRLDGDSLKGEAVIDTPDGQVTAVLDLKRVAA
jgi:hypothetical protein